MIEKKQRKIIFEYDYHFGIESIKEAKKYFEIKKDKGVLEGQFEEGDWIGNSGIKRAGITFQLDSEKYKKHGYKMLGINETLMGTMLRSYVSLVCTGVYTFVSIQKKTNMLIDFLETIGTPDYWLFSEQISEIKEFLFFIDTPLEMIESICKLIHKKKAISRGLRNLESIVTYMVINEEIDCLYGEQISEKEFVRWFPVYFWVKLTFILPLRATETLVTPFDCIKWESDEKVTLITRVTKLKRHRYKVYYDIEKDYERVSYSLNATSPKVRELINKIKKYQNLTKEQKRAFLFKYNEGNINEFYSRRSLNELISQFMDTFIIGNEKYDYVKDASRINEFKYVTAGDSRPLALQNVYFQDFSLDICRQLAKHTSSQVTSAYIRNIPNTIMASAIMKVHKRHLYDKNKYERLLKKVPSFSAHNKESVCTSLKRMIDPVDISDCINEKCIEDCFGCKFYHPSTDLIEKICDERKRELDKQSEIMRMMISNINSAKKSGIDLDFEFLKMQTAMQRCKDSYTEKEELEYQKWIRGKENAKQDEI